MRGMTQSVEITTGDLEGFEGLALDGLGGLTHKQARFVIEYCADYNGTAAAIRAGYSDVSAHDIASENLRKPEIRKAVADRMAAAAKAAGVTATFVIAELYDLATADPRELSRIEIDCCRHCYGIDHKCQWTMPEYESALDEALAADKPAPQLKGGFGFDPRKEPRPECPGCHGRGVPTVIVTDSRKLSKAAAKLMASASQRKDGTIESKLRDQDAALVALGRVCGVFKDRQELSGPAGGPLQLQPVRPARELTNAELEEALRASGYLQGPITEAQIDRILGDAK
jgi:phage terminase small subunit